MGDLIEFDTDRWRQIRDEKLREWLDNEAAIEMLLALGQAAETWDDLVDRDEDVPAERLNDTFYDLMVTLPRNAFYNHWKSEVLALVIIGINAWQDATELEKGGDNDKAIAYTLRDFYMELVYFCIWATRGKDYARSVSLEVRRFFGHSETLEEYMDGLR